MGAKREAGPSRRLVLASGSPTRLRVLRDAGFDPEAVASGIDEDLCDEGPRLTPQAVLLLAERKGRAVASRCGDALVIACDSMLDVDGEPVGKPGSATEAASCCRRLSGSAATLFTGHWLMDTSTERAVADVAATLVRFTVISDAEIEAYVATGEPLGMAGSFSIDGYGAPFIGAIEGDPSNVLGISLPLLREMLTKLGVGITDLWRRPPSGAAWT